MCRLARLICKGIIDAYSEEEFVHRMGDAKFVQALGCVLGFDWHSSGLTTTTMGAVKIAVNDLDTGLRVVGGKGKLATGVREELDRIEREGVYSTKGIYEVSRLTAKIDSACVQDGYSLYHHNVIFGNGVWCVIQQGMCEEGFARRYHWLSDNVKDDGWFSDPHSDLLAERIECKVLNLASSENERVRVDSIRLLGEYDFERGVQSTLFDYELPRRHRIDASVDLSERDVRILNKVAEVNPKDYKELILINGVGARALRALAMTAELIYGSGISWEDPVKYAYAHGGKDGIPFPVQRDDYENTIEVLEHALYASGVEKNRRMEAINRLRKEFFGQDQ